MYSFAPLFIIIKTCLSKCISFGVFQVHLGQGIINYTYKLGDERLESNPTERGLGVWTNGKLTKHQLCGLEARRANCAPGVHQAQHSYPVEGGNCLTLRCTGAAPPPVLCAVLGTLL